MAAGKTPTKSEKAYQLLKDSLQTGQFSSGKRLTELGLAKELNMSRAPVREAMLRLEAEGLVSGNGAYRGKYVAYLEDIDPEQVLQQYELRAVVEGLAARLAAKNMNGWEIDEMRELHSRIVESYKDGDRVNRMRASAEFHQYIIDKCRNQLVINTWETHHLMPLLLRSPQIEDMIFANLSEEDSIKEHGNTWICVVDAIASHNPDEAERCTRQIIRNIADAIRKTNWKSSKL